MDINYDHQFYFVLLWLLELMKWLTPYKETVMIRRLIILLLIVGCGTEPEDDNNFEINIIGCWENRKNYRCIWCSYVHTLLQESLGWTESFGWNQKKIRHRIWPLSGDLFFWYLWDNQSNSGKVWGRIGLNLLIFQYGMYCVNLQFNIPKEI